MKLRTQLLLAAGITLFLPWAGYQYVVELDTSLRENQSRTLAALGETASAILQTHNLQAASPRQLDASRTLFAHTVRNVNLVMDGYNDDWPVQLHEGRELHFGENKTQAVNAGGANPAVVRIVAMRKPEMLYLFLQVRDDKVIYHNPQKPEVASGDHLMLRIRDPANDTQREYFISGSAPGVAEARFQGKRIDGVRPIKVEKSVYSIWQETASGYNIEVRMPLPPANALIGIAVGDIDHVDASANDLRWTGTFDPRDKNDVGAIVYVDESLQKVFAGITPVCGTLRYFDASGWLRAATSTNCAKQSNVGANDTRQSLFDALLQRIFEQILHRSHSSELVYLVEGGRLSFPSGRAVRQGVYQQSDRGVDKLLSISLPSPSSLSGGAIFVEQEVSTARAMSTQALVKVFSITVLAAFGVSLFLLFYASLLSWRIRKLRDDTVQALADNGEIVHPVTSRADDEIGDLSRGLATMLTRIQAYNDYQKSLASRLTHELRTPLTVARTSLESMEKSGLSTESLTLLDRSRSGIAQLSRILQSLSEATSLEQVIGEVELEELDLARFASTARDVYASIYPQNRFLFKGGDKTATVLGNAELLRQLLDKLVANATEFSSTDSVITLQLVSGESQVMLTIHNVGAALPRDAVDLFSPMVSVRRHHSAGSRFQSDSPHLGLGLYIARLIAERHKGELRAVNEAGGVSVTLILPVLVKP